MNVVIRKFHRIIQFLSRYPPIGKFIASVFGIFEVPLLELIYFIDKRIKPGSYHILMKNFFLFYKSKIIPLNVKIESIPTFAPTEEILGIIRRVPAVSIGYCYCRVKNKNCGNPIWTCIHIGTAKHLEELSKKIPLKTASIDEVEKLLYKANELGLVHQLLTTPSPEYIYVICNCCPCCCIMLRNAIEFGMHGVILSSNFLVEMDKSKCINCGKCSERCYFNALTLVDGKTILDVNKCTGCGLCVNSCTSFALKLIRRNN
ncbi:MAG: hypothetical protein EAX90_04865 [Candidatus Heimdallarchaeota archaeon]|nr:hypothetical protein [Candidatus Heimdallarchaeota archaeon]